MLGNRWMAFTLAVRRPPGEPNAVKRGHANVAAQQLPSQTLNGDTHGAPCVHVRVHGAALLCCQGG